MTFENPILPGFHPDPSICRVGDDFYLATSTFEFFPGLPLFHSRDLIHWTLIGHAMDRPEQLSLRGVAPSQGLYAPTLRHHQGRFYLVCTHVTGGGNFVITADQVEGPWSLPVFIPDAEGIDPSLFFDDDGRCWWVGHGSPEMPLYPDHKLIWLQEFDVERLRLVGPKRTIVSGGARIEEKPVWLEGPHLYKVNGRYFLFAAEGGTEMNHSEVVFRSDHLEGPYESAPSNPLVTHRDRPDHAIACTGHADLVETPDGEWWMVLLGCRPYAPNAQGRTNLGRETFLVKVEWENGWPVVENRSVPLKSQAPSLASQSRTRPISFEDSFLGPVLNPVWTYLRTPDLEHPFWSFISDAAAGDGSQHGLAFELRAETLGQGASPAFLGIRLPEAHCRAEVTLTFSPTQEGERAGLALFYRDDQWIALEQTVGGIRVVRTEGKGEESTTLTANLNGTVRLGLEVRDDRVQLWVDGAPVGDPVDGSHLNSVASGGFTGCFFALFATSTGQESRQVATFSRFSISSE